jgi:hypothetical protein
VRGAERPWPAGPHPLPALAAPYLARPWLGLRPRPGGDPWARTVDPAQFQAAGLVPGTTVLLLDDAWVSGASAPSAAAVALKLAGAAAVAVVVAGRHIPAIPPPVTAVRVPPARHLPTTAAAGHRGGHAGRPPWVNRLGS